MSIDHGKLLAMANGVKQHITWRENGVSRVPSLAEMREWESTFRALAQPANDKSVRLVRFIGINPLEIGAGATEPMLRDSWRFAFSEGDDGVLRFSFNDNGSLVATAATAQPAEAVEGEATGNDLVSIGGRMANLCWNVASAYKPGSGEFAFPEDYRKSADQLRIEWDQVRKKQPPTDAAQAEVAWRQMETAPRDGTMLRLLVEFTEHATEDSQDPSPTIGANNFYNDGEDEWLFAGWCWTHDHFTQGEGTPVGWLPLLDTHPQAAPAQGDGRDCTCQKYEGRDCRRCFNPPYPDGKNPPPLWGTKHWQGSILQMVGEMRNFADVADRCELTEGNAPAVIRLWADRLAAAPSQEPKTASESCVVLDGEEEESHHGN